MRAALWRLGLLLLLDLGGLRLDLTSTRERSVDLTHIAARMLASCSEKRVRDVAPLAYVPSSVVATDE